MVSRGECSPGFSLYAVGKNSLDERPAALKFLSIGQEKQFRSLLSMPIH